MTNILIEANSKSHIAEWSSLLQSWPSRQQSERMTNLSPHCANPAGTLARMAKYKQGDEVFSASTIALQRRRKHVVFPLRTQIARRATAPCFAVLACWPWPCDARPGGRPEKQRMGRFQAKLGDGFVTGIGSGRASEPGLWRRSPYWLPLSSPTHIQN